VGLTFYLQGQTAGTTTLTVSAPGFVSAIINITVDPSGFVITSPGSISATHGGATSTVTFEPAILNAGVLTVEGYGAINPGIGTTSLSIGSTSPQIGTIAPTTVSFPTYSTSGTATFTPLATGTTDIDIISQPTGFTTPSQPSTQQIVATVQ
jgi:hypothetical protein